MGLHHKISLEQTVLSLFLAIDENDARSVAARFTNDGVWHRRLCERVGRAAIMDEMHSRPAGRRIQHLVSNFIVMPSCGQCAEVAFKTLAFADDHPSEGKPSAMSPPIALDAYRATLVERDGSWLITSLKGDRLFAAAP